MQFRHLQTYGLFLLGLLAAISISRAEAQSSSSSSSASTKARQKADRASGSTLDLGSVSAGVYHNKSLGLTYTIPPGWVLRTEEMNSQENSTGEGRQGKVLLAAFSRPPEAKGADVNSSILVAGESAADYPGLKDPEQYFEPLTEVAKAQGFVVDEEPYDVTIGARTLVRSDFHKDVGSRVMHQSTLVMLSHGYAVSITLIAGREGEIEDLIGELDFGAKGKSTPKK